MITDARPGAHALPELTFVVFDRRSGDIVLTHHLSAAPGASVPDEEAAARFVLEHATLAAGYGADSVDCLRVRPDELTRGVHCRVHVAERRLVEVPAAGHPGARIPRLEPSR